MAGILSSYLKIRRRAQSTADTLDPLLIKAQKIVDQINIGEHNRRRAGQGEKFWQFRDYAPSDRPQDIDWRQSGKTDRVFVRQKEKQNAQNYYFWVQNDESMKFSTIGEEETKGHHAKIIAFALAILLARAGEKVAALNTHDSAGHSDKAIEALGMAIVDSKCSYMPQKIQRQIPTRACCMILSDFMLPLKDISNSMSQLPPHSGYHFIQILDPAEIDLPYSGRAIFQNLGTQNPKNSHDIANIESIKNDYKDRISNHIQDIKILCDRYGHHHHLYICGSDMAALIRKIIVEAEASA